ncbi:MAG TPA: acyltransferase family protein [Croceibacterium sp.]
MSATKYRPDIDGLRAIAVIPVVLFHADFAVFSGGFVGVDIFFVISGYLITSILLREIRDGSYSLARFYERRARRIIPALVFMLAGSLAAGLALLLPLELTELGSSSIATALFSSNFFFYLQSGYFDAAASTKPLLHTWSLAVEEQYYIFFPIALWLGHRWYPKLVVHGIVVCALLSLGLSIVLLDRSQSFTFYMLPTRAWELFAGGIVAAVAWRPRRGCNAIALAGAAMILAAILLYDETMPFPGAAALLPVAGAVAIIFAGEGTATGRVLALAPFRAVGLVSYSLYLWHWPIIVYARFAVGPELAPLEALACVALSLAMAAISWRYVEQPFRRSNSDPAVTRRALGAAFATLVLVCVASAPLLSGLPARLPERAARVAAAEATSSDPLPACFAQAGSSPVIGDCLDAPHGRAKVVLWGDSHALHLFPAVAAAAEAKGLTTHLLARASCMPLIDVTIARGASVDRDCARFNALVLDRVAADPQVRTVILAGRWVRVAFPEGHPEGQSLNPIDGSNGETSAQLLRISLLQVIDRLLATGKHVMLVGDVPEFERPLPSCLARRWWQPAIAPSCGHRPETLPGSSSDMHVAAIAALRPSVTLIRPAEALCPGRECLTLIGGEPVSKDEDHLSEAGAVFVVRSLGVAERL